MNRWSLFTGDDSYWKDQVYLKDSSTYLQDIEWAKHLENLGWTLCRWHYEQNGKSVAFLQGFLKRYPFGIGVLWFPDWIVGSYKFTDGVTEAIRRSLSLRVITIRIRSHHEKNDIELDFLKSEFTIASKPFGSSFSMHLDLSITNEQLFKGLTKNWRRNLKRSKRLDHEIVEIRDVDTIANLYINMTKAKGLSKVFFSEKQIESIIKSFGANILIIGAKTPDGSINAIRGAIIRNDKAFDIFAAANAFSRKNYLSYSLCWELLNRCKSLGCDHFDFSGVDPENNMGVYNFKKGTGSFLIESLGEFEYSNSYIMNKMVTIASRWRN